MFQVLRSQFAYRVYCAFNRGTNDQANSCCDAILAWAPNSTRTSRFIVWVSLWAIHGILYPLRLVSKHNLPA